jgi:hypothetical protein
MSIVHRAKSAILTAIFPGTVTGPNWNDTHQITLDSTAYSANATLPSPPGEVEVAECTGGSGGITLTLPSAAANPGLVQRVKKVDSGAGPITLVDAASATIDGAASYVLANQWQYVVLQASRVGGTWNVIGGN